MDHPHQAAEFDAVLKMKNLSTSKMTNLPSKYVQNYSKLHNNAAFTG